MSNTSIDARRERRRKRKRQVLIYKMLILLALVAALVVCLVMAVRSIHPKTPKTPDTSAETSSASGSSGSEEGSGGESESVPADISGSDKYRTDDRAGALALAEDLASHYDYDTALAVLAGYSGSVQDENGGYQFYYGGNFLRVSASALSEGSAWMATEDLYRQTLSEILAQANGQLLSEEIVTVNGEPAYCAQVNMYGLQSSLLLYAGAGQPAMFQASYMCLDGDGTLAEQVIGALAATLRVE